MPLVDQRSGASPNNRTLSNNGTSRQSSSFPINSHKRSLETLINKGFLAFNWISIPGGFSYSSPEPGSVSGVTETGSDLFRLQVLGLNKLNLVSV